MVDAALQLYVVVSGMILIMIDDVRVSERGARSACGVWTAVWGVRHSSTMPYVKRHITFLQPCRKSSI